MDILRNYLSVSHEYTPGSPAKYVYLEHTNKLTNKRGTCPAVLPPGNINPLDLCLTWGRLIRQKGGLNTAIKKISVLLKKKRQCFDLLKNCHSFYFIFRIFSTILWVSFVMCFPIFVFHAKYSVPSARWQLVHFLIATSFLACLSSRRRRDLREYWHNCWK